uniref:Synaptonemal complex central element protein 3 n=1 Tax=Podarcis muralis TaxID=64176 RepID=A0A670JXN6_PODMU
MFSAAPEKRTRSNGSKLQERRFHLNIRKNFLTVRATWMAYDMVVMRANPDLANSMRRLEDAFLTCKEEMEKNWQEMLKETKGRLF